MSDVAVLYADSLEAHLWIAERLDPANVGLPETMPAGGVRVPVCQYNFYRLPQVIRFAGERFGFTVPDLPAAISVDDPASISGMLQEHIVELKKALTGLPVSLEYPAHDLDKLLGILERNSGRGEDANLLRLLGAICNQVYTGPKTFHLDVSNLCNTDCVFCGLHSPHLLETEGKRGRRFLPGWGKQQLHWDMFKRLVDDLAELGVCEDILLSGEGEPLTHPRIADMIAYIKQRGMHLTLFTNGLGVKGDLIHMLPELGVDVLYWSLSAATPEVFQELQPSKSGEAFEKMLERFSRLCDLKRSGDKNAPYVILAHVINSLNYKDTAQVASLAMQVGVDAIRYQVMHSVPATQRFLLSREQYEEAVTLVERGKGIAKRAGIDVVANIDFQLPSVGESYEQPGEAMADEWSRDLFREIGCLTGWFFARNFTDGRLSFCCHDKIIGNLNDSGFAEIWKSESYAHTREVARDFDVSRNVDLTDDVCGSWLLGPDCKVCGNYEFILQARDDLTRMGLLPYLHKPTRLQKRVQVFGVCADVHDAYTGKPGSFDKAMNSLKEDSAQVLVGIHKNNFLHLDKVVRNLAEAMGIDLGVAESFSPVPVRDIFIRFNQYVERMRQTLSGTRISLGAFLDDLAELLTAIGTMADNEGDLAALRVLGAITGEPMTGPKWFIFEIINACNARCLYCNIHNPDRKPDPVWLKQRLSFEEFKNVVDDLADIGAEGISLLANGEPLLHSDFSRMVEYGRSKGLQIIFFTNGTRLDEKLAELVVESGVSEINITVSAATPSVYARIHHTLGEKDFHLTSKNIRRLSDIRKQAGETVPRLIMVNVVTSLNAGEVEEMIRLAARLGFDEVRFQMIRVDEFNQSLALSPEQLATLQKEYPRMEETAREEGVELWNGFAPQLEGVDEQSGDWEADRYIRNGCFVGNQLGLLKSDGDFSFCCVVKPLGNLADVSFKELWNSVMYRGARRAAVNLAERGSYPLADGSPILSDRCHRCDNHDVNRLVHEALTRYGLWRFTEARAPEDKT